MPDKAISLKCGADRPKNPLGRTGTLLSSERMWRRVSTGNGSFISVTTCPNCEHLMRRRMSLTRSGCLSAATTLSSPLGVMSLSKEPYSMSIGKAGQIEIFSSTLVRDVQRIRRLRRRGEENTSCRHLRHTCTSKCHFQKWVLLALFR